MNSAKILNGTALADKICQELKTKILDKKNRPGLAAILVGENPASQIYVKRKEKTFKEAGFYSEVHHLSSKTKKEDLLKLIKKLNQTLTIDGILVQLPLPSHLLQSEILNAVSPEKDVDGFHPMNLGHLLQGSPRFIPCTPKGIMALIQETKIGISGKHAVVVGRSIIVGKPTTLLLLQEHATVTICHSKTQNLQNICQTADILVVAIGKPHFIDGSFIKDGAIVIDVGIHRTQEGLVGDVDFDSVKERASYITPVPGGVGPMTIAMLLQNTWESFSRRPQ